MVFCKKCKTYKKYYSHGLCKSCYNSSNLTYLKKVYVSCGEKRKIYFEGMCMSCIKKHGKYSIYQKHISDEIKSKEKNWICISCKKIKIHYSFGMCRSCYNEYVSDLDSKIHLLGKKGIIEYNKIHKIKLVNCEKCHKIKKLYKNNLCFNCFKLKNIKYNKDLIFCEICKERKITKNNKKGICKYCYKKYNNEVDYYLNKYKNKLNRCRICGEKIQGGFFCKSCLIENKLDKNKPACEQLEQHHDDMKEDSQSLTTKFMKNLIGIKCK